MKVNYQGVREAIARRVEFKGNHCEGVSTQEAYTIYSYATAIYHNYYDKRKPETFNLEFYSTTTSKLQGIIADVIFAKPLDKLRKDKEKYKI